MKRLLPVVALTLVACGGDPDTEAAPPRPPLPSATVAAADLDRILLTPKEAQPIIARVGLVPQPFLDFEPGDGMRDANDIPRLTEALIAYDTASGASRQLARLTDELRRCASTTVTVVTSGFDNVWYGPDPTPNLVDAITEKMT